VARAASRGLATSGGDALEETVPNWRRATILLAVAVAALAAVLLVTVTTHDPDEADSAFPVEGSADAGFARDMQVHHAQAVEMALLVRDRTTDPIIRAIAYDIATAQQQQIGQMFAWLELWGLPQTSTDEPMAWMEPSMEAMEQSDGEHSATLNDMTLAPDGRMPGMASAEDLARLSDLEGVSAEELFLALMIRHHEAGVVMAEAAATLTTQAPVRKFALTVAAAQRAEIKQMLALQQDRTSSTQSNG
jgi:uncharacterized protein (DUF305 family)